MPEALINCPATYRLADGRALFVPFAPNRQTPDFWREVARKLADRGLAIAFVPDLLDLASNADSFAPISAGLSFWGARDPRTVNSEALKKMQRHAASLAQYWMQPVAPQDARPYASILWEAANTELLRASWMSAIQSGADFVHMITWNDYGEGTEFSPSSGSQFLFYDLSAYYIQWYKTGHEPVIDRDAIYYSHRTQLFDPTKILTAGDRPYKILGLTPVQNNVEMVALLTHPATLEIKQGSERVKADVEGGLQVLKMPAKVGRPVFRIIRNGRTILQKESDWTIDGDPKVANAEYFGGSSTRAFRAMALPPR